MISQVTRRALVPADVTPCRQGSVGGGAVLRRFKSGLRGDLVVCLALFFLAFVIGTPSASADAAVHVDCAAAPGGNGAKTRPFHSITAALPSARAAAVDDKVTIDVAPGICDDETLPLQLDFPVHVRGSRSPVVDEAGAPIDGQVRDTLLTWIPPSPVPPSVAALSFFRITGPDVRISRVSIDGRILPGTVAPAPPAPAPRGVLADGATGFLVDQVRMVRVGAGVWTQGAAGEVRGSYFGTVSEGLVLTGGDPTAAPLVIARNNRIENYWTAGVVLIGAGPSGRSLRSLLQDNDTVTSYADTGPSNPVAFRINLIGGGAGAGAARTGSVESSLKGNRVRGTPRYAIIVSGGRPVRRPDRGHYSGTVSATFGDNLIDATGITRAVSLVTFTNSRATELPCELNPASTREACPSLMGNPPQYWEYLEGSRFDFRHDGELDGALIDHPAAEPSDGRVLVNELIISQTTVPNQTFVVVP